MNVKNDNEHPDHFTKEVGYDDLIVGKRYKLTYPDGTIKIVLHSDVDNQNLYSNDATSKKFKYNDVTGRSIEMRIPKEDSVKEKIRFFAKTFSGGARRRTSRRNKRRAIRRKSRRNYSA